MIESHNRISIYLSSCLDKSSRKFRVNTWFQFSDSTQLLKSNILIQLKYSSQEFWLESSLDESRTRLDAISLIMFACMINHKKFSDESYHHHQNHHYAIWCNSSDAIMKLQNEIQTWMIFMMKIFKWTLKMKIKNTC